MAWRGCFGQKGAQFGAWISKPGYDVLTASPGDYLLDTNSFVAQTVLKGDTLVATNPSAGTHQTSVPLPSTYSSYSNLLCWGFGYVLWNGDTQWSPYQNERAAGNSWGMWTSTGVLYLRVVTDDFSYVQDTLQFRIAWIVMRGQF